MVYLRIFVYIETQALAVKFIKFTRYNYLKIGETPLSFFHDFILKTVFW